MSPPTLCDLTSKLHAHVQLSGSEASNGLVLPAVAITYFGQTGAVLVVIICFMAVTSSGAGEGLACTSLFTYDVYRRYIKPKVGSLLLLLLLYILLLLLLLLLPLRRGRGWPAPPSSPMTSTAVTSSPRLVLPPVLLLLLYIVSLLPLFMYNIYRRHIKPKVGNTSPLSSSSSAAAASSSSVSNPLFL